MRKNFINKNVFLCRNKEFKLVNFKNLVALKDGTAWRWKILILKGLIKNPIFKGRGRRGGGYKKPI